MFKFAAATDGAPTGARHGHRLTIEVSRRLGAFAQTFLASSVALPI